MRASEIPPLLAAWIPGQRWYAAKGHAPELAGIQLTPMHGTSLLIALVTDDAGGQRRIYQVPFALEDRVPAAGDIGRSGNRAVVDAAAHPALLAWLTADPEAHDFRQISGEQSNTSLVGTTAAGPTIVKLFRVLEAGTNPEVELGEALLRRGCDRVPALRHSQGGGWMRGDVAEEGTLAVAHEFIADGEDAWRGAATAAEAGRDIDAFGLGEATARVHLDLAAELGTEPATDERRQRIGSVWKRRAAEAIAAVPQLAPRLSAVEEAYANALAAPWPHLQRIHGDLHLGQVMHSPSRGWLLLDFEGEPLRPLAERRTRDLALRDVAGMLRSFDYAASAASAGAATWAGVARESFLSGYARSAQDPREHAELLRALELDKALYEARYEAGNRPDWLGLPLAGIDRLLGPAN